MFYFDYFLADLGGILGLFIGGSAISIFEIIDLFVYNFITQLTYMRANKRQRINKRKEEELITSEQQERQGNCINNFINTAISTNDELIITEL